MRNLISGLLWPLLSGGLLAVGCQSNSAPSDSAAATPTLATAAPPLCAQGMVDALRDFERGHYELHSPEFVPTHSSYLDVLADRYHIGWSFVESDAPGTYYGCYDSLLLMQLRKHYGTDFLAHAQREADSLDANGTWHAEVAYPGDLEAQRRFIYSHLDWQRAPALTDTVQRPVSVFVSFRLDETGQVQQPQVIKGLDEAHNREALRVVGLMPRWQPAYERGRPVARSWTLPIRFTRSMQVRYGR